MKANQRIWTGVTAAALMTSVLTACTSSNNEPAQGQAAATSKPAQPASFTILSNDGGNPYAKQVKPDDKYFKEASRLFSEFSGKPTTVNWQYLDAATYSQLLSVRFASNDLTEVISSTSITDKGHPTAVENGAFLPLNELLDKYGQNIKKKVPQYVWDNPSISRDGKIYAIPKLLTPLNPKGLYYRKDWLDKLGLKPPETLEDYLAYFEAVKTKDPNGNGQADEIGYPLRGGINFGDSFFGYFGANPGSWTFTDGKFIPDIIRPEMKQAIAFYKQLYDKGYINKDFATINAADWSKLILSDKAALWTYDLRNVADYTTEKFAGKSAKVDFLPGPKNAQGKINIGDRGLGVAKVFMINAKSKNPERFVEYMNWIYSDDAKKTEFFDFGIEGQNFAKKDGKIEWNAFGPENKDDKVFYQTMMNPSWDARMDLAVVEKTGTVDKAALQRAIGYTETNLGDNQALNMPALESIKTKPELGIDAGSLFLDMFAKVVSGKENTDTAFDKFVSDWKKRGGDDAIKEATDWYNKTKKK
ncbi:extracellular solute-binding protein [Paenibacillus roseipurpureus]|uniref:Extracellular solute-binding protein n=1 Tax=Paenibacillus roseopurpureus TaxID=2918901 RepID=A0AA96RPN7_9BACL|nr:extracellular solute-binding protein [Paenibacillus sp. MBLB1832]WNR46837.1 extracellular solute-binding protein [Paenibacillus sp. MBLB1832]